MRKLADESFTVVLRKFMDIYVAGEPFFVLAGHDATAALVVDFWVSVNIELRQFISEGFTLEEAVEKLRRQHYLTRWHGAMNPEVVAPKLLSAAKIAAEMADWPVKKVAA